MKSSEVTERELGRAVSMGVDHNLEVQNLDLAILQYPSILAWVLNITKTAGETWKICLVQATYFFI